jgi:hypothetical protein
MSTHSQNLYSFCLSVQSLQPRTTYTIQIGPITPVPAGAAVTSRGHALTSMAGLLAGAGLGLRWAF